MTFTITDAQSDTLSALVEQGWKLSQVWHDGVIDAAKIINGTKVMVFIAPDGTCRPPRTHATMIASSELHTAGVTVKSAKE